MIKIAAILTGFLLDQLIGDPHSLPHPVVLMGKIISWSEKLSRRILPKTKGGEITAGALVWIVNAVLALAVPGLILYFSYRWNIWAGFIIESVMIYQILAAKSLRVETMKVYRALKSGDIEKSRLAVSMVVGRDTKYLDDKAITRAAVETIAENTSDGVIAPLLFSVLGGAPLGFLYKAINTMDSMLGYVDMPYKNVGLVPAKADDVANYIPARLSAFIMLMSGGILGLDIKNGYRIFKRDRYKHASPNSAQTESVVAGLLNVRLAGDAVYHGVLHKKQYIGDDIRQIRYSDIPLTARIMNVSACLAVIIFSLIRFIIAYALQII